MNETSGYTQAGLSYLWMLIKLSVVYRVLTTVYSAISNQWNNSKIIGLFRNPESGVITKDSLAYRGFTKIFSFSKSKFLREHTESILDNSIIIKMANYLLHNLLAFNLKFIGWLVGIAVAFNIILTIFASWQFPSILSGGIAVLAFILMRFDVNVTSYLADSALLKFIQNIIDCKFNFDFFYKTKTKGESRIICAIILGIISGLISFFASPFMAVVFILGLTFAFLVIYKTMFGVFITVFLAPILPTMLVAGLCVLTLVSFIFKVIRERHFEWKFDVLSFLVMALLGILFVSAVTSFVPMASLQVFVLYAAFMSFYFVLVNMIKSREQLFSILVTFIISGTLVSLFGLMQHYFGLTLAQAWVDEEMFATIGTRIFSTLENPNVLGTYLLFTIPIAIALMWGNKKLFTKITFAGIAGIMFLTLILTFSRGCWIALFFAMAMYITFVKGKMWGLVLLVIPFIPVILNLLPQNIVERITSIGNLEDTSSNYRLSIWLGSLNMLRDWWVAGIGLGSDAFMQVYPLYAFAAAFAFHSHNLYMQVLAENGIVGFITFMLIIGFAFKALTFAWNKSTANPKISVGKANAHADKLSVVPIGIAAALFGFLLQGIFDHALYNYRVFLMFWMVIGFATLCKFVMNNDATSKGEVVND